jgi:hypothetical protein
MSSIRLHTRRDALCALAAATTAVVGVLGGVILLFGEAGSTPAFAPGSRLAGQAARCQYEASMQMRHQCLHKIAASAESAANGGIRLAAHSSADPKAP